MVHNDNRFGFGYSKSVDWDSFTQQERDLLAKLPHGSGIDLDWRAARESGCLVASNEYHHMDENGFYAGWSSFDVMFTPDLSGFEVLVEYGADLYYTVENDDCYGCEYDCDGCEAEPYTVEPADAEIETDLLVEYLSDTIYTTVYWTAPQADDETD